MRRFLVAIFMTLAARSPAEAKDLMRVYEMALANDTQLRAAASSLDADEQLVSQALGSYLPQVTLNGSIGQGRFTFKDVQNGSDSTEDVIVNTDPFSVSLQITQALFNHDLWLRWKQSHDRAAAARASYRATEQQLALRVTRAYFDVLAAEDNQRLSQAENAAVERQLEHARKRYEVGLSTITDMHEAQARYDLTVAQLADARQQLRDVKDFFTEITDGPAERLMPLREEIPLLAPSPDKLQSWIDAALENNLDLMVARINVEIAHKDVKLARAGHYPTLDLTGSHTVGEDPGLNQGEFEDTQVMLTVNVPLFRGGSTQAGVRRNLNLQERSQAELEGTRRRVERQVRSAFESVQTGVVRVNALKQALVSNRDALDASEAGLKVGVRNAVDVLNAQRQLSLAQRDYARARYDYLVSILELKRAAGQLEARDLHEVDKLLVSD